MTTDSPSRNQQGVSSDIVGEAHYAHSAFELRPGSSESFDNNANQVTTHS